MRKRAAENVELRSRQLLANARAFLGTRGLDIRALADKASQQYPGAAILLTSSPVQGLATPTSDIDLIAVTAEELPRNRMATQIYVGEHHCEVSAVGLAELDACLTALRTLADAEPREAIAGIRTWDKAQPVSRKYLERVINGVSPDGRVPHSDHMPDLARVWGLQAFQRCVENAVALRLSVSAGEQRSPSIYAAGMLSDLMDALLCDSGFVYSNKKWILTRWTKDAAAALDGLPFVATARDIAALHATVCASIGGALTSDLVDRVLALLPPLEDRLVGAQTAGRFGFLASPALRLLPYGKGAQVALFEGRAAILRGDTPPDLGRTIAFDRSEAVDDRRAGALLNALRTGIARAELVP